MKALYVFFIATILFIATNTHAQVNVNVNIGSPPQWGPAGYSGVRYYYLPDVQAYYDIQTSMFIYMGGGIWLHRATLPSHYRHYDLYRGYKVVMTDYHGNSPYVHFHDHKVKYKKGYRGNAQKNIGEKPGNGNAKKATMNSSNGGSENKKTNAPSNGGMKQNNGKQGGHGGGKGKKK